MTPRTLSRPVALDRGDVLRIRDGGGLAVRPTSGVLWVTEERSVDDRVVGPGETCRLEGMGLALVYAQRAGQVVIDVPARPARRPDVQLATHGGDDARPIALALPPRRALMPRLRALWRLVRARTRVHAPDAPVGGWYAHDGFLSSRRRRGGAVPSVESPGARFDRRLLPYY